MSSTMIREPASFGKRREPHKIIVVRNGKERQYNINPMVFSAIAGMLFMFLFGYFGATAYLIFRDDLISSSYATQARMQHEYEDRIAALRSKLDRVTSRQLLDQQSIENQVRELMARQQVIGSRDGTMKELLKEARKRGLRGSPASGSIPIPASNPLKQTDLKGTIPGIDTTITGDVSNDQASLNAKTGSTVGRYMGNRIDAPAHANAFTRDLFGNVAQAIGIIDANQRREIDALRIAAAQRATQIGSALKSVGVNVNKGEATNVGGPFVPFDHSVRFETHLLALQDTLEQYDRVTSIAKKLPLGSPVPGAKVSSYYGPRIDPFNGRTAMHGGIDFRAATGTPVLATGEGVVTKAKRIGGYGKVVEVRHKNGYTTRYAHLSRIHVKVGQRIRKGKIVGKVGSTGRSTGPHLHYEVRRSDKTRNPSKYIKVGNKISGLL